MLVVTPKPKIDESLSGYILRLSESNGYDTPWHILSYAGFNQGEMKSPYLDLTKLSQITGHKKNYFDKISYSSKSNKKNERSILGLNIGYSINAFLETKNHKLCPQCVTEKGYIEAYNDLTYAVSCPEHNSYFLKSCPSCNKPLKLFRPGLLKCRCGTDLIYEQDGDFSTSIEINELMAILKNKLERKSLLSLPNQTNYPVEYFENKSLLILLSTIKKLSSYNRASKNMHENSDPVTIVNNAAEILSDWPYNFHKLLLRLEKTFLDKSITKIGLLKSFEGLYLSLFRNKNTTADFIKREFFKFIIDNWTTSKVNRNGQNYKQTEMGLDSLRQYIIKGTFNAEESFNNLLNILPRNKKVQSIISVDTRSAALVLDLPVKVLKKLRDYKYYKIKNQNKNNQGFHEIDLVQFKNTLIDTCDSIEPLDDYNHLYSLHYILEEKRFRIKNGKSQFVMDFLDKKIY